MIFPVSYVNLAPVSTAKGFRYQQHFVPSQVHLESFGMADPLSIAGVAYPIAKDFLRLCRRMKRAYQDIRYAKQDLFKAIKRTNTVAQTFEFFSESLDNARGIEELDSMFERHGKLIESVNGEAKRTIKRLDYITTICRLMMNSSHISPVQRCIAYFEWYRASKNVVPSLFYDMKILERSMRTIGILVNTQILHQVFLKTKDNTILTRLLVTHISKQRPPATPFAD